MGHICRICNNLKVDVMPWGGTICRVCKSISITNLPTLHELSIFYQKFNKVYYGGGRKSNAKKRQDRYACAYIKVIHKFRQFGTLIDIGSSTNPFPNYIAKKGFDVTVADLNKPERLDPGIRFINASLNDELEIINRAENEFDIVTNFAVIEHCRDPRIAVKAMSRLCSSNGIIVLTTPDIGSFTDQNFLGRSKWFNPPEHLHLISRKGLERLFNEANFNLIYTCKFELNLIRWLARYGLIMLEGIVGAIVKKLNPKYWKHARSHRIAKGQGIALYVFRKQS